MSQAAKTDLVTLTIDGRADPRPAPAQRSSRPARRPGSTSRPCATTLVWSPTARAVCASSRSRACGATPRRARPGRGRHGRHHPERRPVRAAQDRRRAAALRPQGRVPHVRERGERAACRTWRTSTGSSRLAVRGREARGSMSIDDNPLHRPRPREVHLVRPLRAHLPRGRRAATSTATPAEASTPCPTRPSACRCSTHGCEVCGQCVSTCPTGALTDTQEPGQGPLLGARRRPRRPAATAASGCTISSRPRTACSSALRAPLGKGVNNGNLCAKGRYGYELREAPRPPHHPAHPQGRRARRGDLGRGAGPRRREAPDDPRRVRPRLHRWPGAAPLHERGQLPVPEVLAGRRSEPTTSTTAPVFDTAPPSPVWRQRSVPER